ncbi:MAG: hypothetical protein ACE5FM_07395, partial [Methyloligellaceae bacterium]
MVLVEYPGWLSQYRKQSSHQGAPRRRRKLMLCWIAGIMVALLPIAATAQPLDRAMESVVSVLPQWPPDAKRFEEPEGSGVVVLDGKTIVTALHVVDKALS